MSVQLQVIVCKCCARKTFVEPMKYEMWDGGIVLLCKACYTFVSTEIHFSLLRASKDALISKLYEEIDSLKADNRRLWNEYKDYEKLDDLWSNLE